MDKIDPSLCSLSITSTLNTVGIFASNKRLVRFLLQLANFVSDIGGSLGLWIGMSVLSFAEVLELILLIAYALYVKLRRKLRGRIRSASQIARK